ncbi:MAG: pyrroline-5-carboxylate reductase [Chitinophagaceae bacterium]|nr:pyrroline-5-carboxylate reductase [Chitinophagaceae bacterium]MCZ2396592.1 pyrroline-5-carboxylate reductase [Chitinophagales bacterium]
MKIAIIGGGNLGSSIASGLAASRFVDAKNIRITRRNVQVIQHLKEKGFQITNDNNKAVKGADVVILAVKPFQAKEVLEQIHLTQGQILVSTVTGVWLRDLTIWAGAGIEVFRAMPNTAIAVRKSMTCIAHGKVQAASAELVCKLFNQLGSSVVIDEKLMDAATVVGACGIAYVMRFIRACTQGGIQIGFSAQQAALIVEHTVNGAAALLLENSTHPEQEIDKVTTPRGCTIAGLNEMEHYGFSSAVIKGLTASYDKILE